MQANSANSGRHIPLWVIDSAPIPEFQGPRLPNLSAPHLPLTDLLVAQRRLTMRFYPFGPLKSLCIPLYSITREQWPLTATSVRVPCYFQSLKGPKSPVTI